jgi:hypothetical protein
VAILALALPAWAASRPGTISGIVTNSAGVGQMGASIEVIPAGASDAVRRVFSGDQGQYAVADLAPGQYQVRVSANSFLPTLRENVRLTSGTHLLINVTLSTLFEAIELMPKGRNAKGDDDEWRWTLRSVGNRPILRVLDDGKAVVVASSDRATDRHLKATVAFVAGSEAQGFGSNAETTTAFSLERSMFSSGTFAFGGNLASDGDATGVLRASYAQQMGSSRPEVAITFRRLANIADAPQYGALEALSITSSDTITFDNILEITGGTQLESVEFARRVNALKPFGRVAWHLDPNTVLEYRYTTSQPDMRATKGFETAPADLTESGPRMSLDNGDPVLERARHQEIALSRRFGNTNIQLAAYADHISDAALLGVGGVTPESGDFLPDVYSNTFTWNGGALNTNGVRLVMQQHFSDGLVATLDYATGGVIALTDSHPDWDALQDSLRNERRHAVALKLGGQVARTKTRWLASYRWTNGHALTPVDWFDASPGQADPYFSVFVRQPIPAVGFLPEHMEVLVDIRNLLAQGYVPVIGRDGQTLYLVQAARSVRGGVAFNF